MVIHIVAPGETLSGIAGQYGVPLSQLILDNAPADPDRLAVGQALLIQFPAEFYTVRSGDTLASIALAHGLSVRALWRNNPALGGSSVLYPGQRLVLSYRQQKELRLSVCAYAYPSIDQQLLRSTVPFLTDTIPFTYGITPQGDLVYLNDLSVISMAQAGGSAPRMHLSTLTKDGNFSDELAHIVLTDRAVQNRLIARILTVLSARDYRSLDVDFEYISAQDAGAYADFIRRLAQRLNPLGYPVCVALAPKTAPDQKGQLYEGHDYAALGQAANEVFLMTYEWGYTYGPPMAVAPLPQVRRVVEYALSVIPAEKIWLGIPNYGYSWPVPFRQGEMKAQSISNQYAVSLAVGYGAQIRYSEQDQAPYFRYTDESGLTHEVWFEDVRSIRAKLMLVKEYGLRGAGYWNLMRPFTQNWQLLNALCDIRDPLFD